MYRDRPRGRAWMKLPATYIIASIIYIIFGVYTVMHPAKVEATICYAFGIILTIYGVINVIAFFFNKDSDENLIPELIIGGICVVFGIFTLFSPDTIKNILLVSISVIIIIDGVMNIKRSFWLKDFGMDKWYVLLIISCIAVVLGIVTIVFKEALGTALMIMLGIALIYEGVNGLMIMFLISRNKKRFERNMMMVNAAYEDKD